MARNKRLLILICASLTLLGGARMAAAQDNSSQDPLADAARKAQAAKKSQPKPTKVYTDDNIGSVQGQVSVVGQGAEPAAASGDQSGDKDKTPPEKKDQSYYRKKFADLRLKLADDEKELDVLQREYGLKQQQYYSDPNTAMKEEYSRKDLNDTSDQIDKKKQDITDDQQAISDLEDDLRRSGGDPGWARDDAPPDSSSSTPAASEPQTPPTAGQETAPSDTTTPPPTPAPEAPTTPSAPAAATPPSA